MNTRRCFLGFGVPLAVAAIGMFPGLGFSQHHGGGGGGVHSSGGSHSSGAFHSGSGGNHSGAGSFHSGANGFHGNYGGGGYHNPGAFNGGYHGGYYQRDSYYHGYPYYNHHGGFYPGYYDSFYPGLGIGLNFYPGYYRYYGDDAYSAGNIYYYSPSMMAQPAYEQAPPVAELDSRAFVTIRVPMTDAQVWIEDQKTSETETTREYRSPPLEQGHHYTYEIQAQWKQDGQVYKQARKFPVNPGDRILVEFAKSIPSEIETKSSAKADLPNAR